MFVPCDKSGQNFALSITEAQLNIANNSSDASDPLFTKLDLFVTIAFTVELLLNLYADWFWRFATNPWSIFDLIIVLLSLISFAVSGLSVRVVLLLRCCRVLRIFGKVPSVSKIFAALFKSLVPMSNAFFIIFIVAAICKPPPPRIMPVRNREIRIHGLTVPAPVITHSLPSLGPLPSSKCQSLSLGLQLPSCFAPSRPPDPGFSKVRILL